MTAEIQWTDERLADLRRHFDAGLSMRAIGTEMNLSKGTVSGKVDRLGWVRPQPEAKGRAPRKPRTPPKPAMPERKRVLNQLLTQSPCLWPTWSLRDDRYWSMIRNGVVPRCGKPATVRFSDIGEPITCPYCEEHANIAFTPRPPMNRVRYAT